MKVSVIVPIYNSENYLCRCLDSISNQSLDNIEIICVNDGSTDSSLQILEEYAKKDTRIIIVDKENGGLVSARKAGVRVATGEYIGFVDSDDWIEADMYESLYNIALKYCVDIVTSGYYREGNYVTEMVDTVELDYYNSEDIQKLRDTHLLDLRNKKRAMSASLCSKIFRADLLKEVQAKIPDNISLSEDRVCLLTFLLEANSAYIVRKAYYHWVINPSSMSLNNDDFDFLNKINNVYNYITGLYNHPSFSSKMRNAVEGFMVLEIIDGINKRMGFKNKEMLRIDPYWLDMIPNKSRIITYGGGDLLEQYKRQLRRRTDITIVENLDFQQVSKVDFSKYLFDYVLITIKNAGKASTIKEELLSVGVPYEKILWFEQPELFWKYAEAEGLLD